MNNALLAMVDMRGNLVAAAILLIVGVILIRRLRPSDFSPRRNRWVPIVAFLCGPTLALLYFVVDVAWLSRGMYIDRSDYHATLWRVLVIGVIGGAIGAFALWIGSRIPLHRDD